MKRLFLTATLIAAGLATSACVTIIDATHEDGWKATAATPFDEARDQCRQTADVNSRAFETCMAGHGWTRD
ncbi:MULTISPECIES: hypothetical protein [Brevundimonas]|uniref:hypothetical protein n=1 Tax=Brevundimonas TaxID=41275 RepID=UPI001ADA5BF7|nr:MULTISPECIES: hypothetical protein [Brevundimonas]MBO9501980.1 hypothetical protein [Brevundimonas sp. A19_0]